MKLDIKELKAMAVPDAVVEFMTAHGTNHQLLLKAWKDPGKEIFGKDLTWLVLCLAYEMQKDTPKAVIIKRLRGRISKVRHAEETFAFDCYLNPGMGFLK